ncbi:hypothetical protein LTR36_005404 [Oleoguttula mirabilis]|uniref:Histidine kinase n=1 Tax=Oleoguttula mirabilis TaxID=1507867 RepID=A0AAV9JE66_9PEZI|nr:hypothetical protein LTR36_005404 [Oleoguttula mirabilis]
MRTHISTDAALEGTSIDDVYAQLKECDSEWLAATLAERWRTLTNEPAVGVATESHEKDVAPPGALASRRHLGDASPSRESTPSTPLWAFDVTLASPPLNASEHVRFFRSRDWAATELGPMASWSVELRGLVNVVLTDPRPAAITYGKSHTLVYNEPYLALAGDRHPRIMGLPMFEAWSETEEVLTHSYHLGETTGQGVKADKALFLVRRQDRIDELWASWVNFPVAVERGTLAYYNQAFEITAEVIAERRMSTLLYLAECISTANDTKSFWSQAWKGLEPKAADIPFAAFYALAQYEDLGDQRGSVSTTTAPSESSIASTSKHWILESTLGLPADCSGLPTNMDFEQAAEQFTPVLRQALQAGQPTLLLTSDGSFPKGLIGVAKSRESGTDCGAAVLCPVRPSNRDSIRGFVLIGINPRRAYDTDYRHFMQLLSRQMATSMASIVLIEEELRRSRIAAVSAASERLRLSERLAETAQLAEDSDARFLRMADLAPVGIFQADGMGNILYANKSWSHLTEHPNDGLAQLRWYDDIHEEDRHLVDVDWSGLAIGETRNVEVRLRKPFVSGEVFRGQQVEGHTWIIASAYAERNANGALTGISGCFTDISRQKWAEEFQQRQVQEAQEMKRQQENFMDMISHEARNPLSAIILSTDSMIAALKALAASAHDPVITHATLQDQLDSAETIMTCAVHQKGIIDDVLTLSKLDSGLLQVTPVEVQLTNRISKALRVFEIQLQTADVSLRYLVKDSYKDLGIDWVYLDPSRLVQVLINLITNAIKFTTTQSARRINVSLDASLECPSSETLGVQYLTRRDEACTSASASHTEAPVYLSVTVQDTGRGLTEEEMKTLFQRFQQASPKTHVEYGGSGLGLFISRELVRLQGGQIGVASIPGKGSTFAFYVVATRATAPKLTTLPASAKAVATQTRSGTLDVTTGSVESVASPLSNTGLHSASSHQKPVEYLLIVEDNLVNQKVMSKQLTRAGYKVSVANHGLEALEHIRRSHFSSPEGSPLDVVLMDVEMPIMGGLECTRKIRAMQESGEVRTRVPIIGVTANAREQQQSAALEAGMDLVVTKPFRLQELIVRLAEARDIA